MKKSYVTPDVEKVAFQYRDQVVATSAGGQTGCLAIYNNEPELGCKFDHWASSSGGTN